MRDPPFGLDTSKPIHADPHLSISLFLLEAYPSQQIHPFCENVYSPLAVLECGQYPSYHFVSQGKYSRILAVELLKQFGRTA